MPACGGAWVDGAWVGSEAGRDGARMHHCTNTLYALHRQKQHPRTCGYKRVAPAAGRPSSTHDNAGDCRSSLPRTPVAVAPSSLPTPDLPPAASSRLLLGSGTGRAGVSTLGRNGAAASHDGSAPNLTGAVSSRGERARRSSRERWPPNSAAGNMPCTPPTPRALSPAESPTSPAAGLARGAAAAVSELGRVAPTPATGSAFAAPNACTAPTTSTTVHTTTRFHAMFPRAATTAATRPHGRGDSAGAAIAS